MRFTIIFILFSVGWAFPRRGRSQYFSYPGRPLNDNVLEGHSINLWSNSHSSDSSESNSESEELSDVQNEGRGRRAVQLGFQSSNLFNSKAKSSPPEKSNPSQKGNDASEEEESLLSRSIRVRSVEEENVINPDNEVQNAEQPVVAPAQEQYSSAVNQDQPLVLQWVQGANRKGKHSRRGGINPLGLADAQVRKDQFNIEGLGIKIPNNKEPSRYARSLYSKRFRH